jgi:hypothetical protein
MHTLIVVAIGFLLLGIGAFVGHALGGAHGTATAGLVFLPIWLAGAAINLYMGVKGAGYSVKEEAPIFLLVFAIPAAAAVLVWWKFR